MGELALTPGANLDRYELVRPIGAGGMGEVWEALLHGPQGFVKPVALKILKGSGALDGDRLLVEEARTGALLHHPNVVGVYGVGRAAGHVFVVMELVRGVSAGQLARRDPLPAEALVDLALQVCAGLHHIHTFRFPGRGAGLVHRDVKPANLLVDATGLVKVADLGIAAASGASGRGAGTPGFMAPEQFDGTVDPRTDVFALGATLYALATLHRPFGKGVAGARSPG